MHKRKKNRKFGRETKQRMALMRSLANALISHGRITTTEAKAKSLKIHVEKLVTRSKNPDLSTVRQLEKHLDKKSVIKLTKELAQKFSDRRGGYLRIMKLPPRTSDGARMAAIEFVI